MSSSSMHIGATVVVSCIDPDTSLAPELRSELGAALCGSHAAIGTPVVVQKTSAGLSITDAEPGARANATIRVGERPGLIAAPLFDPTTRTLNY